MPLTETTRQAIHDYLLRQVTRFVQDNRATARQKPFHVRLLPILSEVKFSERSFSTRSGSWFQEMARLVASQFHRAATLGYSVTGRIQPAAEADIVAITELMDHGVPRRIPNRANDIARVLGVQDPGGVDRSIISDLFILRHDDSELYFEMKTPDPNKGQCKKMKHDILLISALRKGHSAEAYAAAAYNPNGDDAPYMNNYARQFLEIGQDLLVGRQFWSKIGDDQTYDELLEVAEAVGNEIRPILNR
ncbi:MAG: TdeIII family type II restriction endonuclease [Bacteroidota bacterium]|nr:TdeIII family type II restriction endonuclease [Bacteroidota bacterium]MDP4231772.1 TdeIII family type II restriction endonuclease [Bacteroidota bacterium]MDP4243508.1 TdeIII family type II restriction endonuclease [Bacteroidota bacterium]MDP4287109.1 TdeIII family type II restriction endonuclease [Bacteroidota bacterium]